MYKLMRHSVLHRCPAPQAKLSSHTHWEVEGNHPSFRMPTDLPMSTSTPNYHGWLRYTSMCRIFGQSDIVILGLFRLPSVLPMCTSTPNNQGLLRQAYIRQILILSPSYFSECLLAARCLADEPPSTSNYHGLRQIHHQAYLIIPDSLRMPSVLPMNTWAPNCYRDSSASLYMPNTWAIIRPLDDCHLADEYHSLNHYSNPLDARYTTLI
jgi:hypothetical protein